MIQTKEMIYKKAYAELNQIFKILSQKELEKIPSELIKNISKKMDKEYVWEYDNSKSLLEQNLMPETKALIVEIYERYICPEDEKEFWGKYDKICLNKMEKNKAEKYNPNNIFKKEIEKDIKIVEYKGEKSFIEKFFEKIKNIFRKI